MSAPTTPATPPSELPPTIGEFRASASVSDPTRITGLGPLRHLPGTWVGRGFNVISRPDFHHGNPFFLQLNETRETLSFEAVGAPIPNRGSRQDDIIYNGVNYLQRVSDMQTGGALHLEPGFWLHLPVTQVPNVPTATVVRLATIPHGDSLLAQGTPLQPPDNWNAPSGQPRIDDVDATPVQQGTSTKLTGRYLEQFSTAPLPGDITRDMVLNPNLLLRRAIEGQHIFKTKVLIIDTAPVGGITNVPFVVQNADAVRLQAVFWIEFVRGHSGHEFMQLQYTQTVTLRFDGIDWPHISVATLVKQ